MGEVMWSCKSASFDPKWPRSASNQLAFTPLFGKFFQILLLDLFTCCSGISELPLYSTQQTGMKMLTELLGLTSAWWFALWHWRISQRHWSIFTYLPILPCTRKLAAALLTQGVGAISTCGSFPSPTGEYEPRSAKQLDKGTICLNLGQQVSAGLVDEGVKWNRSDADLMSTTTAHHSIGQAARPKGQAAYHHQISWQVRTTRGAGHL